MLMVVAPPALAERLEDALSDIIRDLSIEMYGKGFGTEQEAQIFIRAPRDNTQGVVCTPLSNFIQRKFRSALNRGLSRTNINRADVVPVLSGEGTQLVVNLRWRRRDDERFDIITSIGQFVNGRDAEFFSTDLPGPCAAAGDHVRGGAGARGRLEVPADPLDVGEGVALRSGRFICGAGERHQQGQQHGGPHILASTCR